MRHWHSGRAPAFQAGYRSSILLCRSMRIKDLKIEDVKIGIRIRSFSNPNLFGTIVDTEYNGSEVLHWIQWDGEDSPRSGFYWNDCDCEIMP